MHFVGLDFGTNSVRGIVYDVDARRTVRSSVCEFASVLDLPDGSCLFTDANEWIRAGKQVLNELAAAGVEVAGVGVAFTSCTMVPIDERGEPIGSTSSCDPRKRPHLFAKMWKHHSPHAQVVADELTRAILASDGGEWVRENFGGSLGLEWMHPKILEIYDKDREAFNNAHAFVEAGDFVVWGLCGKPLPLKQHFKRSTQQAAFKGCYVDGRQLVPTAILTALRPTISMVDAYKVNQVSEFDYVSTGTMVGRIPDGEQLANVPVAVAAIDAHACAFGLGAFSRGRFVMVVGTSACFMMSTERPTSPLRGVAGSIPNGIIQGLHAFEFGQSSAGDCFAWLSRFTNKSIEELERTAVQALAELMKDNNQLECWAVDHLNGCRTPLMKGDARGSLRGISLNTQPAHAFLAFVEAVCFGIRVVVEILKGGKVQVTDFILAGGLSKSLLFQNMLATVLTEPILVYEDGGEATGRGAAAYASMMVRANLIERFQPLTHNVVRSKPEYLRVVCNKERFERYVESADVRSFL